MYDYKVLINVFTESYSVPFFILSTGISALNKIKLCFKGTCVLMELKKINHIQ